MVKLSIIHTFLILLFFFQTSSAQEQVVFNSEYLSQPDTTWFFTPDTYSADKSYPLLYLLHGYSEDYKQWNDVTDLQQLANKHQFVIVTPDGFKTWYIDSPVAPNSRFEDFFFEELAPLVHKRFNIDKKNIFISGLSMGGYGALRLFILNPDYFNSAGSTSGGVAFNLKELRRASLLFLGNEMVIKDHVDILGNKDQAYWDEFSIATLLKQNHKALENRPFIFDIGTDDPLYAMNKRLKYVSDSLDIPVTFTTQPGSHTWQYWGISIHQHMAFFNRHLK